MVKKISLFSLVMLIVASIDSVRNLPVAALFGSALIFVFIASAIIFLIPTGLVAAELTATYPEKGGVYHWVHEAFGEKLAMVAIWMQWINTMVWYPTTLAFIAGTAAYLIHPELAEHKGYLIGASLTVFWFITLINFSGLHFSSWISSICGIIGTVCPLLFLAVLGAAWVFTGQPLQISINTETLIPSFADATSWISIIAVMSSFLGMELAGVHVNDIKNPQKNFPRAVFLSSLFILVTMILGSLAIALVLPSNQINFVSGVMQVLFSLFEVFHLSWLMPVLTVLVVIGTIGSIINWLISPAKGLLHAAEYRYLPPFFTKKNSRGVPVNILLMQGVLVSLLCFVFFLVPSVNAFYWFLVTLSTELYMVMYVLMFLAAIKLHYKFKNRPLVFKIPGKSFGMWVTGVLGILGSLATIVVSFFPPPNIEIGSKKSYIGMMVIANILAISPVFLFYFYKKSKEKKALL